MSCQHKLIKAKLNFLCLDPLKFLPPNTEDLKYLASISGPVAQTSINHKVDGFDHIDRNELYVWVRIGPDSK